MRNGHAALAAVRCEARRPRYGFCDPHKRIGPQRGRGRFFSFLCKKIKKACCKNPLNKVYYVS
ncbi:hypothetical protein BRO54_2939 [Geobacillus proteiniphilus]|uniref:Uncharacterized protein n=1 Tax=Geobacillus proteiniphilus TaxID=860353 RepID=A0A1Q5SS64_9BACL|nr:hypothetical protein BRO54_2939 [Geobacillus proteiniphilus]